MDVFDLVAKLTLDSSEYEKGLGNSEEKAKGFGSKVGKVMKGAAIGITAITTATAAVGGAFVKATAKVADYGDHIDKMSQKMGLSAEKYQEWDAILQHSGTSIDAMKASMKTLANAVENGNEAFERIGLTQQEIANMSQEELFEATITGLQNVEDTTERTYLAGQLLGRGATELGALLNTSAEDTEKMRRRVHELGGVMSDDAVKAAARYQDSLQDMQTALNGAKRNIVSSFLPALADVMDGLGNLFSGDSKTGLGQIRQGISDFIKNLTEAIPKVIEVGGTIVKALGQAVIENLPTLLEAGVEALLQIVKGISESLPELIPAMVEAVLTMVDGLLNNIDKLVEAAMLLIGGLAKGLIKAIPILIEKAPKIIASLVKALLNGAGSMLSTGVDLMDDLGDGLWKAFKSLLKDVKKWFKSIPGAISDAVGDLWSIGSNIINGLWVGISDAFSNLWDWLTDSTKAIPDLFKTILGIASPSKVFKELGKWIPEGLAVGIEGNMDAVEDASDAMADATTFVPEEQEISVSEVSGGYGGYGGVEINVYATPQQNERQIAEMVQRQFVMWEKQRRAAFV